MRGGGHTVEDRRESRFPERTPRLAAARGSRGPAERGRALQGVTERGSVPGERCRSKRAPGGALRDGAEVRLSGGSCQRVCSTISRCCARTRSSRTTAGMRAGEEAQSTFRPTSLLLSRYTASRPACRTDSRGAGLSRDKVCHSNFICGTHLGVNAFGAVLRFCDDLRVADT